MKKYLLLVEDEGLWKEFKEGLSKDINTEIIDMIKKKVHLKVYPKKLNDGAKKKGGKDE